MTAFRSGEVVQILLAEDNQGDVDLTIEALRDAKVANELHVVRDGEEAMEFLQQSGRYTDAPRPDLVLLDLNMPRKDGREVLSDMKDDAVLRVIPVVILTTSEAEADVLRSYELAAAAYVTKPVGFSQFVEVIHAVEDFWLTVVKLPPRTS
jgi:two-component system, chemotaxis family, response regulator Rcp1